MSEIDYQDIITRIQDVYSSCSPLEQKQLLKILEETANYGYSATLEQIWLTDFKSVPVSIDRFLADPYYMGETNDNGKGVYPYWKHMMSDVFTHGNQYNEIILSGATRIGKSTSMVSIMCYMLYRLMLYRNPQKYFGLKPVSRITLAFANLTRELAFGVAYKEFQNTVKKIPFFQEHGSFTRSDRNYYYVPEGDYIDIIAGSDAANFLGMQVWCLTGDTKILTNEGVKLIEDCAGTTQTVMQYIDNEFVPTPATVVLTKYATTTIKIELEDGSIIEGTPEHRVMLSDGLYKALCELTLEDKLACFSKYDESSSNSIEPLSITSCSPIHHKVPVPVYDVIDVQPNHNFVVVSNSLLVSHNCAGIDEANFARSGIKDINLAKCRMKELYDTINARVSGTFRLNGEVYGKIITASSKNTDNDYLSTHIETQLSSGNTHLYLVDEPQWVILPKSKFSDKKFHFTVGDRYKKGFVIPEENDDEAHRKEYEELGYKVIEAPAEFRKNFLADYDIALRDIAGISVAGALGFITQEMITPLVSTERQNPFFEDILKIGVHDTGTEIYQFFHEEVVPSELKYQKMNIHIDLAESYNRTGISGCCTCGNKIIETEEGKKVAMPFVKQVFQVAIAAPTGQKQSFQKVVNFIIWLRQHHFNIGTITTDSFQSDYLREVLAQQNFEVDKISIEGSMDPYIGLRNMLVDQRIELVKHQLQEDELVAIQRSNNKLTHPVDAEGGHGDCADALCGSAYSLIRQGITAAPPSRSVASIARAVNRPGARLPSSMYKQQYTPGIINPYARKNK